MPMNILRRDVNFPQILNFPNLAKVSLLKCPVYGGVNQCYSDAFFCQRASCLFFSCPGIALQGFCIFWIIIINVETAIEKTLTSSITNVFTI